MGNAENHYGPECEADFYEKTQNFVIGEAVRPQALNSQVAQISQVQPWLEAQHESESLVPPCFWFSFQICFLIRVSSFRISPC